MLEDVNDADELEDQQHEEHDADDGEHIAAGRQVLEIRRERSQLLIGQCRDAFAGRDGVDAVSLELAAHFLAREHGVDARDRSLRGRASLR